MKRWCCIRIVDEHEDVNTFSTKNRSVILTTPFTTTTKKHKKTKSKKTVGTKQKKHKKSKKSEKSKSKSKKYVKDNDKHLIKTGTTWPSWTTILTEITKNKRTESPKYDNQDADRLKYLSIAEKHQVISTPSYFSLPKHTHISHHSKYVSSSNMREGLSGGTKSAKILKAPVTTISESSSTRTTKSSITSTPSSQSILSTVSSVNQDINIKTSNLSVMSTSGLKTSTSHKTDEPNSVSLRTYYERTSLNPDKTVESVSKSNNLKSSSLATSSKQTTSSSTAGSSSSLAAQDIEVTAPNRLATKTTKLSHITDKVTSSELSLDPNNEETTIISVASNKPTTSNTPPTRTTKLSTKQTTSSSIAGSSSSLAAQDIEVTAPNRLVTKTTKLFHITDKETSSELSSDPNNEETLFVTAASNKPTTKSINSIRSSSKLISSLSSIYTTSNTPYARTTKPSIKPHHLDYYTASNIRARESGEESTIFPTQKTTVKTKPSTIISSTISYLSSVPLDVSEMPSNSNFEDTSGKLAAERHLESSEKYEPIDEFPSSISTKRGIVNSSKSSSKSVEENIESKGSEKPLNQIEQESIEIESSKSTLFTSIKPASLLTYSAATEDVFANRPSNSFQSIEDSEVVTTILSIPAPATLRTISSPSEPINSTTVDLIRNSLLSTETPFLTESSASKVLKSSHSTQNSKPSKSVTSSLTTHISTIAQATTFSKKVNHAARLDGDDNVDEDDDDDGPVVLQQAEVQKTKTNIESLEIDEESEQESAQKLALETEEESGEEEHVTVKGNFKIIPRQKKLRKVQGMKLAVKSLRG